MFPPAVLVIGASGAIGSRVIDQLLPDHRAGELRLVAATRQEEVAASLRGRGVEVRRLDLDDAEMGGLNAIRPAFQGIDRVFLLTGYTVRMLIQSKAVVDAARAANVSHLVHLGASGVDNTTSEYAAWHQLIEAYIERSGIGFTHVRPSSFMQNLPLGAAGGALTHFIGDGRINWVDVDDVAAVAAAALREPETHRGRAYDVTAEAASIGEIASLLNEITGRSWRYEKAKPDVFFDQMVGAGYDPIYLRGVRNYLERIADGSLTDPTDVFHNIEAVLGRKAVSIRRFIELHRDEFER